MDKNQGLASELLQATVRHIISPLVICHCINLHCQSLIVGEQTFHHVSNDMDLKNSANWVGFW